MKQTKRRRIRFGNKNSIRKRTNKNKNEKERKIQQCSKIIQLKACEICEKKQDDQKILLCDECDDAYHWTCLQIKQAPPQSEIWLCPNCITLRLKNKRRKQKTPQNCFKCKATLKQGPKPTYICNGQNRQLFLEQQKFIKCQICQNHYHSHCFSIRNNSINCWECQINIRKKGPHSHEEHLIFIENQLILVRQKGYFELQGKIQGIEIQKHGSLMNLRVFEELTDWQLITRSQASFYYALKSRNLIFCDQQVYQSQGLMELNDSSKQIIKVFALHAQDQRVYEIFKAKIRRGAVFPYQVKQDRKIGFYLVALAYIEKGTIISEFSGQVNNHRTTLTEHRHDSIFTLLVTGKSKQDLNIVPKKFGNTSRFISGVNNQNKQHLKRVNVQAVRFSYQNRVRIIFIAKKSINKGQILYLDYNAGVFQQYPTTNFV